MAQGTPAQPPEQKTSRLRSWARPTCQTRLSTPGPAIRLLAKAREDAGHVGQAAETQGSGFHQSRHPLTGSRPAYVHRNPSVLYVKQPLGNGDRRSSHLEATQAGAYCVPRHFPQIRCQIGQVLPTCDTVPFILCELKQNLSRVPGVSRQPVRTVVSTRHTLLLLRPQSPAGPNSDSTGKRRREGAGARSLCPAWLPQQGAHREPGAHWVGRTRDSHLHGPDKTRLSDAD